MTKKQKPDLLEQIELAQGQLRDNIEESKQLVAKTQMLLKKARAEQPPA